MKTDNKHRLSEYVKPSRYTITIKPDDQTLTFEGSEMIKFESLKSFKSITLHSQGLSISEVSVSNTKSKTSHQAKITYDLESETSTFAFPKTLTKGKYSLSLKFKGVIADNLKGIYRSSYTHKGKQKTLITTQFEATDARRAFPCFDEPSHKAIFDITLIVPEKHSVISNTIESKITPHSPGFKTVKFQPTPKMSTYLLAFISGELESIEGQTRDKTTVRIFTTPGKIKHAKFALQSAIKTLEFFNDYFNIPYPLPVLDMIAIPDFAAGAMENWGAVTYRETAILVDEKNTALANKQYVASVIAHELTHQWFGNLVTMEWWTHLWLNEGFAAYMTYVAVDHVYPDWEIWTQFITYDLSQALSLDALSSTHPIEVEVRHPSEIDEIFDAISYSKGASCIRMLADWLGEKDFRDGLRLYLKKHSYKNTSTIHLWEAFEKVSGKPVKEMMHTWTTQSGHPVIKVEEVGDRIRFRQKRFYSSDITGKFSENKDKWPIPIKISQPGTNKFKYEYLKTLESTIKDPKHLIKFNIGEVGVYRVHYGQHMLKQLGEAVSEKRLDQNDRVGLIRDVVALAHSSEMRYDQCLDFFEYFRNETSFTVWSQLIAGMESIKDILPQKYKVDFNKFYRLLLKPASSNISWRIKKTDSHNTTLLRSLLFGKLGLLGDKDMVKRAKKLFKKPSAIPSDLKGAVYSIVAKKGSKKDFEKFLSLYRKTDHHEEKNRLGRSLGLFTNPALFEKALKFAFSSEVRLQDSPMYYIFYWRNDEIFAKNMLFKYLKSNWKKLHKDFGQMRMLGYMVKSLTELAEPRIAQNAIKFIETHPFKGGKSACAQTTEKLKANIRRAGRAKVELSKRFTKS